MAAGKQTDEDTFLTVRVPSSLRDAITALAEKHDRTLAAEIREALRDRIKKFGH